MKIQTAQLLINDEAKDSLIAIADSLYQQSLSVKDAIIETGRQQYISLKQRFDESTEQLELAATAMKRMNKQLRRRRTGNKIIAVAIIVLSGVAVGLLGK